MSLSFWIRDYIFLPLAMLRREVWWRNLALLVAMILFGLWHKATVLFLLWGCYHGVLLVLHRQLQRMQRKFDWEPAARFWIPVSWMATMLLINLGWIFFRANSLPEAVRCCRLSCRPRATVRTFWWESVSIGGGDGCGIRDRGVRERRTRTLLQ